MRTCICALRNPLIDNLLEYTVGAGYTNDEGQKVAVSSPKLAPSGIILDAELTLPTPERLWYAHLSPKCFCVLHKLSGFLPEFAHWTTQLVCIHAWAISLAQRSTLDPTENLYRPLIPPPLKVLCYASIIDLFKYLPKSKEDPTNVIYRQKLQLASWLSLWPIKLWKYRSVPNPEMLQD